ncbi:DUF3558 domain-containing protein [Nocardia donostiensis]|uniref:DUF3558 domain-containing protein n=1 Tax=Nocardia donostiensis TaxID=1538463 RepID=A0A1V2TC56_9NOCA|nr:DUF3558 domain-containing protein [Nocardia donostiensis]ONM47112.1 hypothetical protein B0T46_19210 [Nocardia donostiensis]OQS20097.1 hypothetical protein B0T44_11200 [Nocardia donostiensis]
MRIPSAIVTGLALALLLSACGGDGDSDSTDAPLRPPPKVAALGPFVGECGHVTDEEVSRISGIGQIAQVFKNSVGCNWQAGGMSSPSVTFASYRGSPIEREKAWVSSVGRAPETIEVGGHTGFQALDPSGSVCDLAVQLGDDFFEWSMSYGWFPPAGDPCDKTRELAELTVQRLG